MDDTDATIVETSLREMEEEVGVSSISVLGILRCDWSDVMAITGVAVTPVVGYIGEMENVNMRINPDEVENCFTIPLSALLDQDRWSPGDEYAAPVLRYNEHVIWGLTGYLTHFCLQNVILPIQSTGRLY